MAEDVTRLSFAGAAAVMRYPGVVRQSAMRTTLAGLIGNTLEWFDFAVYGYFATDIGRQFFPTSSATAQQLLAFAVFGIGFAARPVGSVVLGIVGDRIGRRALLTSSILLMGVATLLIGLLPTYAQIGALAPLLLVTLRLVQGFSVGAEFTGSMVYTTELAAPDRRGLIGSSAAAGVSLGFILGSASAWLVNTLVAPGESIDWRWRLPFLASILLVAGGWFLRRGLQETAEGVKASAARPPVARSLLADWRPMIETFGIAAMNNAVYYLIFTFVVDLRSHSEGGAVFLLANTLSLVVVLFSKAFGGWLSDYVGRRRLMIALTVLMIASVAPLVDLMMHGSVMAFAVSQALLAIPIGMAGGLQGSMIVEIFPLRTRVTSMSVAYSVTLALAGGSAPLVSSWLISRLGYDLAPAWYVIALGVLGLAIMWPMRETNSRALDC